MEDVTLYVRIYVDEDMGEKELKDVENDLTVNGETGTFVNENWEYWGEEPYEISDLTGFEALEGIIWR